MEALLNRRLFLQSTGAGLASLGFSRAFAQPGWPTTNIRVIVGAPAGSAPDIFARLIGADLAKVLGQAVYVENKPGANGRIANEAALNAAPDGHTLLLGYGSGIVGVRVLFPKDKADVTKLQPIARFG